VNEIHVLRAQVALTAEVVEACLTDVSHAENLRTVVPGVNGMNWILGHLVRVNAGKGATDDETEGARTRRRHQPGCRCSAEIAHDGLLA
jgi:hypothetical protein